MYARLGNNNLVLTYTNVSDHPTPWTMWSEKTHPLGSHVGNIKISPRGVDCPENALVPCILPVNLLPLIFFIFRTFTTMKITITLKLKNLL